jgi:hypothetical protein
MQAIEKNDARTVKELVVFFRKRLQNGTKDALVFSEFRQLELIQPFLNILSSFRSMNQITRPIIEEVSWAFINFTVSQEFELNCLDQFGFKPLLFTILEETDDCILLENVTTADSRFSTVSPTSQEQAEPRKTLSSE